MAKRNAQPNGPPKILLIFGEPRQICKTNLAGTMGDYQADFCNLIGAIWTLIKNYLFIA